MFNSVFGGRPQKAAKDKGACGWLRLVAAGCGWLRLVTAGKNKKTG
jgi:hypothetical protein